MFRVSRIYFISLCIIVFISSFIIQADAQWIKQSPLPTHLDIRGTAALTAQHIYIAADDNPFDDGGALYESSDGGLTWIQRDIPVSLASPLNGIYFFNDQLGWVYGNENYKTTNGGAEWTVMPFLGSTYNMKLHTPLFGHASGNFGNMISVDGGQTWAVSPEGMTSFDFFDGGGTGLGVAPSGIYKTTDGGVNFSLIRAGEAVSAVYLSETKAAVIAGNFFFVSADSGSTFTQISGAHERSRLTAVSENSLIAWGRSGMYPDYNDSLFFSSDGGLNWINAGELGEEEVISITVVDSLTVIAADRGGNLFRSSDAGKQWNAVYTSPGARPSYFGSTTPDFLDSQTGYYGFGAGLVIKTTDGGISWNQISGGSGNNINDIDIFANGVLIAAGDNGTLLRSTGSGGWDIVSTNTQNAFKAVDVINTTDAAAVDENGTVYKTTDNGLSWTGGGTAPINFDAADLIFRTVLNGWVAGHGPLGSSILLTTDGGATWSGVDSVGGSYIAVDFEGSSGWALSAGERIYRTTDNGTTWHRSELPGFTYQSSDIDFFDPFTGYAVGWNNYAVKSTDGGVSWELLQLPQGNYDFTDIFLLGPDELLLTTKNDLILYSATGGQNWAVLEINSNSFGFFSSAAADNAGNLWAAGNAGLIYYFSGPPPPPLNLPPEAGFEFAASGLTVTFTDQSIDHDGTIVGWHWDFGDSSFSSAKNPVHTYSNANTYHVKLTVTDDDSAEGQTLQFVVAQPNPGGIFGNFTEVTPLDSIFVTSQDEDFWVITTAPADYDSDGDLDIAVFGYYVTYNQGVQDRLLLLRNNGEAAPGQWDFSYIQVPIGELTAGSSALAWGDYDSDGDLDLVLGTNGATVLFNNEAGVLTPLDLNLPGYFEDNFQAYFDLQSISWADYDNDGDPDLLIPSVFDETSFSYRTVLMRNDGEAISGEWVFTETDSVFEPTSHAQSIWADADGDLDLDLLLINTSPTGNEGFLRRYRNEGNGVFTPSDILGGLTIQHGEARWSDYDNDGDYDVLIAGNIYDSVYTNALTIYRNDSENYVPVNVIDCINCQGWFDLTAAAWADYDSDGDVDILLAGTYNSGSNIEGRARIYNNTGGVFSYSGNELPAPMASGSRGGTFSWLDIDGEGDLDYFIAGQYFVPGGNNLVEAQMHIYKNDAEGQNSAPSNPEGLAASIHNENSVTLSWEPSSDDHTPAQSLTYDLEIYRENIPIEIPARLPQPGSISSAVEWSIAGLQPGTYTWRVRSVDASFSGSLASQGEFRIGVSDFNEESIYNYSVTQNYPNPFNPTTIIRYSIAKAGIVTLKVFNAIGEEVDVLVNEFKNPGMYSADFNASAFASGVYFYRIASGDFAKTMKMILIK